MNVWLRRKVGGFALALMAMSLPGPASTACACVRGMSMDSPSLRASKQECPRCPAPSTRAAAQTKQIARASCCKSKVATARAAATPAKVEVERHETTRTAQPAAVTTAPVNHTSGTQRSRAPPGTRGAASTPASYLSDYLRL